MKTYVTNPGYFGPIDQFCVFANAKDIIWENQDNYQKQTYRNRQYIYGANGKLMLNIPILHTHKKEGRQKYKDVQIENQFDWQDLHWKSMESAYRSSPYFEFYEDDLRPLYNKSFKYLMDFNRDCLSVIFGCLDIEYSSKKTDEYRLKYTDNALIDGRNFIEAKRSPKFELPYYTQVFQEKHGFISNLSILDLLFNQGPESLSHLKSVQI